MASRRARTCARLDATVCFTFAGDYLLARAQNRSSKSATGRVADAAEMRASQCRHLRNAGPLMKRGYGEGDVTSITIKAKAEMLVCGIVQDENTLRKSRQTFCLPLMFQKGQQEALSTSA